MRKKTVITFVLCAVLAFPVFANNLALSHLDAVLVNKAAHVMIFTVDLQQENSWRNAVSRDAAWIFMKYSIDAGSTWHHATLNSTGFLVPFGFQASTPSDQKGFFFERKDAGSGNINVSGLQFTWSYGQDGLSDATASAANTLTRVYGIEMVNVPDGAFFAGDGSSSSDYRFKQGSADDQPWYVRSENAITTTNTATGGFYYQSTGAPGEDPTGSSFLVSNSFPKGYKSFYLMKYELTEGEWVSFFNTLSPAARDNRDITSSLQGGKGSSGVVNRNTISWDPAKPMFPASTQRPSRAMTYISWPDAAAFADWAALRPMTELEFEKAARGADIHPVPDEFAWGSASHQAAAASGIYPDQDEVGTEALLDGSANLNRNLLGWSSGDGRFGGPAEGQKGALRAGIFAEASSSRQTSGAGYYGNMELSGNVTEPAVTVGRSEGRQFLGSHGDGELSILAGYEGGATNVDWPGIDQNADHGVTGTLGIGYRGGDFLSPSVRYFQISSRDLAVKDPDSAGLKRRFDASFDASFGARFARTSP